MFSNLGLRAKIGIILSIPILCLVVISGSLLWSELSIVRSSNEIESLVALAQRSSAVVHELQAERGMTAGYLGSGGQSFASELPDKRKRTDEAIAAFREQLERTNLDKVGGNYARSLKEAAERLAKTDSHRQRVTAQQVSVAEGTAFYTGTIAPLLQAVDYTGLLSSDATLSRNISAYASLLRMKENAGQERAVLAAAFGRGTITGPEFIHFSALVALEDNYEAAFHRYASDAQDQAFMADDKEEYNSRIRELRGVVFGALNQGDLGSTKFNVDAADWFRSASARIDHLKSLEDVLATDINTVTDDLKSSAMVAFIIVAVGSLLAILLTVVLGTLMLRNIMRAISTIGEELFSASNQTLSASRQVASSSQSLAEGASEQAASLEEISSTMEQLASMTKQNAENSGQVESLSDGVNTSARKGGEAMQRMEVAIQQIKESSDQTARIIKTIDEIAFQTNLLALNAAVEAARAGDAGKGFAVVAEEVRNLAQRSAEAARSTSELIEASQERADAGVNVTREVQTALKEVNDSVDQVLPLIKDVSNASTEQSRGIDQVNEALSQMDGVTQSNASNAEENSAAGEELSSQAESMNAIVEALVRLIYGAGSEGRLETLASNRGQGHLALTHASGKAARRPARPAATPGHSGKRKEAEPSHERAEAHNGAGHQNGERPLNLRERIQADQGDGAEPPPAALHDLTDDDFVEMR